MTGLQIPESFPLSALVGQQITQVCIGVGQVQLHFYKLTAGSPPQRWEPGARIDIEAGFELAMPGADVLIVQNEEISMHGGLLSGLLNDNVSSVSRLAQNELALSFSSDAKLRLLTDAQGFESYHLHVEGESVDVTRPG